MLKYEASVDDNEAEAVKVAALAGSSSILECMLSRNPNPEYLDEAIKLAMRSPSSHFMVEAPDRLQSVRLLTKSKTNPGTVNAALVQAVEEQDYQLIEHWIESGADPNFRDGRSVVFATQQLNTRSLHHLIRSKTKPTPQTYSRAFSVMPQDRDRWQSEPDVIHSFDSIFLTGGATGPAVDQTLLSAIRSTHVLAAKFVSMVLNCKTTVNVNFEGGRAYASQS